MKYRVIVIIGSSRNDGDTKKLVDEIVKLSDFDTIDLNEYRISYYDYEHKNADDDYTELMRRLLDNYDTFLFATPVYWYSMSGIMKVFFDRITDLLDEEKELGRRLRNKKMAAITCSVGNNLGNKFWLPFSETADYLGMKYIGGLHTITDSINEEELKGFIEVIRKYSQ